MEVWGQQGRYSFTPKAKEILFDKTYAKQDESAKLSTWNHPLSIHHFQDNWDTEIWLLEVIITSLFNGIH